MCNHGPSTRGRQNIIGAMTMIDAMTGCVGNAPVLMVISIEMASCTAMTAIVTETVLAINMTVIQTIQITGKLGCK